MSQNSLTAAALVIAFLIFVIVRGELPAYFAVLGLGPTPVAPGQAGTGASFQASAGGISLQSGIGGGVTIGVPSVGLPYPIPGGTVVFG